MNKTDSMSIMNMTMSERNASQRMSHYDDMKEKVMQKYSSEKNSLVEWMLDLPFNEMINIRVRDVIVLGTSGAIMETVEISEL